MSNDSIFDKQIQISTLELAQIIGVTDRRIRQLEEVGILTKISRGKYDLIDTVQAYISWLREQSELSLSELNLTQEQALLTRTRRKIAEIDLQIMKGELHRAEDVERVMNQMLGNFRARCLAIPSKTAPQIVGNMEIQAVQNVIKREIHGALNELADYDPSVFYKTSKDKIAIEKEDKKPRQAPQKGKSRKNANSKAK